jgi:hypothetical protein
MIMSATSRRPQWARPGWSGMILVCTICLAASAHAEDDRVVDEITPPAPQVFQRAEGNLIDLGANFDANVFQQQGGGWVLQHRNAGIRGRVRVSVSAGSAGEGQAATPVPAIAQQAGAARLARIDAICGLTDAQRQKLRLAMESDIRRVAEEIDGERRKYQGVEVNFNDQAGQRKWQEFQQDVARCQRRLRELGDSASLFGKVLDTTLDSDQRARLRDEIESRRDARWRSMVASFLVRGDEVLGLDQRQHEEIEKLLLEKRPPLRIDRAAASLQVDQERLLVWMILSEIDAKRLRSVVSDRQWQVLAQWANQGKMQRSHIETWGVFEEGAK